MTARVAYGVVLVIVAGTTALCTPIFRLVAIRMGAVVAPDDRRVHEKPTPLLGGVAMLVGFLVGMAVASRIEVLSAVFSDTTEPRGVILAAVLMLAVGTLDDLREVSAPAKVAGIVLCSSVLVFNGVNMLVFRVPFVGVVILDPNQSFLLSVIWVLGMTNAINLIDGLDGLAAGIVAIAAGTYFLYTMLLSRDGVLPDGSIAPLIAVIVLGMCVGFLPFNFHPARIFMGDGGALMLGLLMAASTMVVGGRVSGEVAFSGQAYFFFAPLLIPLFILGVPIVDTLLAIIRRAAKRSGVAEADKEHIHHRLMRLGHGQRRSVLILWAWTLLLSLMVLYPAYTSQGNGLVPIGLAALGLALYTVLHPGARESRRADANGNGSGSGNGNDNGVGNGSGNGSGIGGGSGSGDVEGGARRRGDIGSPASSDAGRVTPEQALAAFDGGDRPESPRPAELPASPGPPESTGGSDPLQKPSDPSG